MSRCESAQPVSQTSYSTDETPSGAVVRAVAHVENVEPTALPRLFETVDGDALDRLFETASSDTRCCFEYAGWAVTVHAEGTIELYET